MPLRRKQQAPWSHMILVCKFHLLYTIANRVMMSHYYMPHLYWMIHDHLSVEVSNNHSLPSHSFVPEKHIRKVVLVD